MRRAFERGESESMEELLFLACGEEGVSLSYFASSTAPQMLCFTCLVVAVTT